MSSCAFTSSLGGSDQSFAGDACPSQLSPHTIASFALDLPPLDESRMSPAAVSAAASLRFAFAKASSEAQVALHSMREAWEQWHRYPIAPSGILSHTPASVTTTREIMVSLPHAFAHSDYERVEL
jgi:hypothetical protein